MLIKLKYFEFLTRSCDPRPTLGNLRMAILAQPHNKQWQNIIEAFVLKLLIKTHLALSLKYMYLCNNEIQSGSKTWLDLTSLDPDMMKDRHDRRSNSLDWQTGPISKKKFCQKYFF